MTQDEMDLLLSLGSYDDKQAMLERQRQQAVALRSQAPVRHSSPLAAFVGGIGDAASGVTSYIAENDAKNQQQGLMTQRDQGRQLGARLANTPPPDAAALLDPGLTPEQLAQMQKDLTGAYQGREQLAGVLGMTGDKTLAPFGQTLMTQSQRGLDQVAGAPERRLQRKILGEQETKIEEDNAPANPIYYDLAKHMKINLPSGLNNRQAKDAVGLGKDVYKVDQDAESAKAKAAQIASLGGSGGLSPEALDQAAMMYLSTGAMPQLGNSKAAGAIRAQIANRAATIDPNASLAGAKAGFGANTDSLKALQKQSDAVNGFEATAIANLDQFLTQAKKVGIDTGSPLLNAPVRKLAEMGMGNADMTAFNTARAVAIQEVSKVLSGAMGNAAVSDSARHDVEGLIKPDATVAQIMRAAEILKQDMHNRRETFAREIQEVRGRISGKKEETPTGAAPAPTGDLQGRIAALKAQGKNNDEIFAIIKSGK